MAVRLSRTMDVAKVRRLSKSGETLTGTGKHGITAVTAVGSRARRYLHRYDRKLASLRGQLTLT